VLPPTHHRILFVPAHLITRVFVGFDILLFLVQVSGTSIAAGSEWQGNHAKIGTNILIGGLGLQVTVFTWFLAIVVRFWVCTTKGVKEDAPAGWIKVL
jgi:hypothetical protein